MLSEYEKRYKNILKYGIVEFLKKEEIEKLEEYETKPIMLVLDKGSLLGIIRDLDELEEKDNE